MKIFGVRNDEVRRFALRPTMQIRLSPLAYFSKRSLPMPEVAPMITIFILRFLCKVNSWPLTLCTLENKSSVTTVNSQNVLRVYKLKVISLRILLMVVGVTFR